MPSTGHSLILQFSSLSLVTLLLITLGHPTCCAVLSVLILGTGSASIVAGESPEPARLGKALQKRWRVKAESACCLPPERTVMRTDGPSHVFIREPSYFSSFTSILMIGIKKGKYRMNCTCYGMKGTQFRYICKN